MSPGSPPEKPGPAETASARWIGLLTATTLGLIVAGYLLQLFSPLRLNHDAVRLLSMACNAHETGSYLVDGNVEQYPPGYPYMVKLLLDSGLGRTGWINLLNLFWLGVSCAGWFWIARHQAGFTPSAARLTVLLSLFSWVIIKHTVIPLTDLPYLGLSTLALIFLQRFWAATARLAWRDLGLALILSLAAMQVRTVGVALLASAATTVACHPLILRHVPARLRFGSRTVFAAGTLALTTFLALATTDWFRAIFTNSYFLSLIAFLRGETAVSPGQVLSWRLTEISALVLNFPLPANLGILPAIPGAVALPALVCVMRSNWDAHRPWILYAGLYMGILLLWPFTDPRFLLPLIPLTILLVVSAAKRFTKKSAGRRVFTLAYLVAFVALGVAALGYNTRLSLAGERFASLYGLPDTRATYAHAFGLEPAPGSPPPHESWLRLLRRFEPRAASPGQSPSIRP